jgi:hypothetical protein
VLTFQMIFDKMDDLVFYLLKCMFSMFFDIVLSLGIVVVRFGRSF